MLDLAEKRKKVESAPRLPLSEIDDLDQQLYQHFLLKFKVQPFLTRQIVSFQANKNQGAYRWYKFKEAFSSSLINFLLVQYGILSGKVLDPFAGSGTALFSASAAGLNAYGIELLPIGQQIISARFCLERQFTDDDFATLNYWFNELPWGKTKKRISLPKLRITEGAYPNDTADSIERYMYAMQKENDRVQMVLRFALLCVLESISFTSKDGQYLRWDNRSDRKLTGKKPYQKGKIINFDQALCAKIKEILFDLDIIKKKSAFLSLNDPQGNIHLFKGSCLDIMPTLPYDFYDAIITSPPYCNRYDYTRTYALELAILGAGEQDIINLRQQMVSCTVENRAKDLIAIN
jgi:DNA modification methylase